MSALSVEHGHVQPCYSWSLPLSPFRTSCTTHTLNCTLRKWMTVRKRGGEVKEFLTPEREKGRGMIGKHVENWCHCIFQEYEGYKRGDTEWCCWQWILHQPQQHPSVYIRSPGFSYCSDITKTGSKAKAILLSPAFCCLGELCILAW